MPSLSTRAGEEPGSRAGVDAISEQGGDDPVPGVETVASLGDCFVELASRPNESETMELFAGMVSPMADVLVEGYAFLEPTDPLLDWSGVSCLCASPNFGSSHA